MKLHSKTMNKYRSNALKAISVLSEEEKVQALQWYYEANEFARFLSIETGINLDIISQVIAVLSPGVNWSTNKKDTINLVRGFKTSIPDKIVVSTYKYNKYKAIRILNNEIKLDETAPKTYNFYKNILDPDHNDFITVDRHASKALLGIYKGGNLALSKKDYSKLALGYKILASEYNTTPSQLQALVWVGYKKLVNR